jgi:hypothetical protein
MFMRYASLFFLIGVTAAACSAPSSSAEDTGPEPAGEALGTAASAASSCGALREVCCANDVCDDGLVCDAQGGLCRVGVNCGSEGEACCTAGRCAANLNCSSNVCVACGATGEACCGLGTSDACVSGDTCSNGTCVQCGGVGELCCPTGTACGGALQCVAGVCRFERCLVNC